MNIGTINKINLNNELAYLVGVIVGDGHISNALKSKDLRCKDYRISIEVIDKDFLEKNEILTKRYVKTKSKIRTITDKRKNRKQRYQFQFRDKSFYYFLTEDLGINPGNKCNSVKIPQKIFESIEYQKSFLAGLFDTDGGIRGCTIGFTSASNKLILDISKILRELNYKHTTESWVNKKYSKEYYGIRISKKDIDKFLKELNFRNKVKLKRVFNCVGVPEWSNGIDNSNMN